MTKKAWVFTLLVGQVFLWTGSAFLSVLYRLYGSFPPEQVTLFTEVLYYVMQAAGIAAYALWLNRSPKFAGGRLCVSLCLGLTAALTTLALLVSGIAVMVLGLLMNFCVGLLSGVYLTRLAAHIPQQCRGRVFGISYAIGSVGTWLLSLPMGGTLLQSSGGFGSFSSWRRCRSCWSGGSTPWTPRAPRPLLPWAASRTESCCSWRWPCRWRALW